MTWSAYLTRLERWTEAQSDHLAASRFNAVELLDGVQALSDMGPLPATHRGRAEAALAAVEGLQASLSRGMELVRQELHAVRRPHGPSEAKPPAAYIDAHC